MSAARADGQPATATIEQRVAEVLREHRFWSLGAEECSCGWSSSSEGVPQHVAAAVVAALELTEESRTYEAQEVTAVMGGEGDMRWGGQTVRSLGWRTETRIAGPWRTTP